ncbi:MAG TPA: EF-hand domain-containing protein [Blastocatellia bacterium]|nr:EF-hand domain-containing protein [Blastocatellia bacterium]
MKKILGVAFSLAMIAGGATTASAQDQPPPPPPGFQGGGGQRMMQFQMPTFADLDKNKDKKISKDEMPSQFPPQMFDRVDTNRDGSIDEEEWKALTTQFGAGRPGGERMMVQGPRLGETLAKLLDGNTDTKVSREEFAKIVTLFDALDKDHNGELTTEEMNGFLRAANEASNEATGGVEVAALFDKNDKNKDGKITAEEMANERAFKGLDLNKDGEVTRSEADTALKQLKKASEAKKTAQPN